MSNTVPQKNPIRRILTSFVAIAAVSVIFGAKALENERDSKPTPQVALADQIAK